MAKRKRKLTQKQLRSKKRFVEMGKKGGPLRAKSLTAKRRREIAVTAINARWAKKRLADRLKGRV